LVRISEGWDVGSGESHRVIFQTDWIHGRHFLFPLTHGRHRHRHHGVRDRQSLAECELGVGSDLILRRHQGVQAIRVRDQTSQDWCNNSVEDEKSEMESYPDLGSHEGEGGGDEFREDEVAPNEIKE
jgi:hypothetical protein